MFIDVSEKGIISILSAEKGRNTSILRFALLFKELVWFMQPLDMLMWIRAYSYFHQ